MGSQPLPHCFSIDCASVKNENPTRVFISYVNQEPDLSLAREIRSKITSVGHHCFLAADSLRLGDNWPQQIDLELERCDCFLLLLSPASAASDMVAEEVRRAKQLHDKRSDKRPRILPLRVCFPANAAIDYHVASYLHKFQYIDWQSEADSERVLGLILETISAAPGSATQVSDEFVQPTPQRSSIPIGLTVSLQQSCVRLLKQCWEFRDRHTLEPLFGIYPLSRYGNAIPLEPTTQLHLIEVVIHNLMTYPATRGEPLLELLTVLRDKRDPMAPDWKDLDELCKQITGYFRSKA